MSGLKISSNTHLGNFHLDLELNLPDSGITILFGPSGSGKTSLLRAIAGLDNLSNTQISFNGIHWQTGKQWQPTHKRNLGVVFQSPRLFPHLSVEANLRYGLKRCSKPASDETFTELTQLLGITDLLQRLPRKLSGGEQQRVAIARALLMNPDILLMDEPLSALDLNNKLEILPYLEKLHRKLRIPVIYVTHSLIEMARLGDYLVLLDKGKVQAQGEIQQLLTDPGLPLASRSDALVQHDLKVVGGDAEFGLCHLALTDQIHLEFACSESQPGETRRVMIHGRDITLSPTADRALNSALNQIPVEVLESWSVGTSHTHLLLRICDSTHDLKLIARVTRKSATLLAFTPGRKLIASIKTAALVDN